MGVRHWIDSCAGSELAATGPKAPKFLASVERNKVLANDFWKALEMEVGKFGNCYR